MKGKVVLITGASSGIGEQMAYEYGRKGAALVIVARRENKLQKVAERARGLGSPDVLPICANVANVNECKRFVDEAINHFGRLDHLVNNAGIVSVCPVEDAPDITNFKPILASKAALISFYEAMRVELAPEITITIVTLGFIDSEMSQGKQLSKEGVVQVDRKLRDVVVGAMPVMSSSTCAKSIVEASCRGERYVTEPKWFSVFIMLKSLCPELVELYYRTFHFKPIVSGRNVTNNMVTPLLLNKAD
ncbi:unnamed protein product [Ilex paraguariensis]|uniref:Uncharacterized protein n=1 Tax=Ilex paraguariensis TaxID=185542 RepID=A0ABC8TRV9_9AQUA